ncbi:MAG: HGGxSTG domain-containing protein [Planctomycetota bacterium]
MPFREIGLADLYTPPKPPRGPKPKTVCGAKTRRGTPCQCKKLYQKGRCKFHGGLSTGPRTPEGRAAISGAMRARWAAAADRTARAHFPARLIPTVTVTPTSSTTFPPTRLNGSTPITTTSATTLILTMTTTACSTQSTRSRSIR